MDFFSMRVKYGILRNNLVILYIIFFYCQCEDRIYQLLSFKGKLFQNWSYRINMSSFYIPRPYYTSILYQYVKSPWINSYVYFAVCISEISHYFYFISARKIHVSLFQLIYFLNKNSLMVILTSIFCVLFK